MHHHKHKNYGRWKTAANHRPDFMTMLINELTCNEFTIPQAKQPMFRSWIVNELRDKYNAYCMDLRTIAQTEFDSVPISIANGTQNKPYMSPDIVLPTENIFGYIFEGLDDTGLEVVKVDEGTYSIQGTPKQAGDYTLSIKCRYQGWTPADPLIERKLNIVINANPRSLWKDIPTPPDTPFFKPDLDKGYVAVADTAEGEPRKDIVAASRRGRSHGHSGIPRDDHFKMYHCDESDWYIIAVADGAGSAKYSRKGSEVACDTVVDYCISNLKDNPEFEKCIRNFYETQNTEEGTTANGELGKMVYGILGYAAFNAHKNINKLSAETPDTKPKDFATTLMLAICKKFEFGWFIATFWVGDGAMCVYNKDAQTFSLLGVPDEGEFSGQTRFLTMPEIFKDTMSLYKRLRFGIKDDFTALMLMTDGVSDPLFGTDANLNNINKWNELWDKLQNGFPDSDIPGVTLTDNNAEAQDQLLEWLNFWMPGEHDDRTIAILY